MIEGLGCQENDQTFNQIGNPGQKSIILLVDKIDGIEIEQEKVEQEGFENFIYYGLFHNIPLHFDKSLDILSSENDIRVFTKHNFL